MIKVRTLARDDQEEVLRINASSCPAVASLDGKELSRLLTLPSHHLVATTSTGHVVGYILAFDQSAIRTMRRSAAKRASAPPISALALMKRIVLASVFWLCSAFAQEKPVLPFEDNGACPFECCTYRAWETVKPVAVFQDKKEKAPIAFRLGIGEKVQGLTGVVITSKYGITKIVRPLKLGYKKQGTEPELSLKNGDIVYTLHYEGEGNDLFWYEGQTYIDQISAPADSWQIKSRPKYDWWVQIKNAHGAVGWSKSTGQFAHMDACE